jgi:hypothetical protein
MLFEGENQLIFTKAWLAVAWQVCRQALPMMHPIVLKAIQMNLRVLFGLLLVGLGAGLALADVPVPQRGLAGITRVQAVVDPAATERVLQLSSTLQIGEILAVMREEGFDYGETLETEMFPGKGGANWSAEVGQIYDEAAMKSVFDAAFVAELGNADPAAIEVMEVFFASERGQRILMLEVQARRALLDESVEDAAKVNVEEMAAEDDPRLAAIREFAEANDLIERNVAGALNANLAFFKGMASSGAGDQKMTEEEMLSSVWSQEPAIRLETETWLYPYLALAYEPLSDDDMQAYLAFSDMEEGKALNAAVFAAFNVLFTEISSNLGRAVAKEMHGEDI